MCNQVLEAIERTTAAIEQNLNSKWVIGFSGGKDSTATLKVFISALKKASGLPRAISLIYCDTGVENPVVDQYVKLLLVDMESEFKRSGLPINVELLRAPVQERFFVKVVGRGYPTPTNSFRWCTKALRINPVARYIELSRHQDAIVVLGVRRDESQQRTRAVEKNGDGHWQRQEESKAKHRIFFPILDLSVSDVWDSVFMLGSPNCIDARVLEAIYRDASGECPIIKAPQAPPCASGRFGCWTCTVVRKDKSAVKMIEAGHTALLPYLEFRNWLSEFRNGRENRWPVRRSGAAAPGPFHTQARSEILSRLRDLEIFTGTEILCASESEEIARLWALDELKELQLGLVPASKRPLVA